MHIHIPDGLLPIWLWLSGYLITIIFLLAVLPRIRKEIKKIPLAGMVTAVALLIMSVPLGLPIHLNLMVLIGILVGAHWSLIVALALNFILASFGHGGLTVIGLNTLVLWFQAIAGIFLFKSFIKIFKNYFASASLAAFISLAVSFLFFIGIIIVASTEPAEFLHSHEQIGHTEISLKTLLTLSLPIALFGILTESLVTGFIVQFIKKVKPDLIV